MSQDFSTDFSADFTGPVTPPEPPAPPPTPVPPTPSRGIGTPSGTYAWNPALAEYILEAFAQIGIFAPALEDKHIIECRRSMNFILSDYANRGINLWTVDQISIPLIPGVATYQIPSNTVDILDTYRRQYGATAAHSLGNALTVMTTSDGDPMLTAAGEPMILAPSSGTFWTTAGSQVITMYWPNHGQSEGSGIFFQCPVTAGPMTITSAAVNSVLDHNFLTFLAPSPASETRTATGGTPLFVTKAGSTTVTVVLAGHNLGAGARFNVQIPTAVGGLVLSGPYTVTDIPTPDYDFTIQSPVPASSNTVAFENQGQIPVLFQTPGQQATDIILTPMGRDQHAALPNKMQPGTPTSFWYDRVLHPTITVWPVPQEGSQYALIAYRTRDIQDANPASGETPEIPKRFFYAYAAELTSAMAKKFARKLFQEEAGIAAAAWDRAQQNDREKVSLYVIPQFGAF